MNEIDDEGQSDDGGPALDADAAVELDAAVEIGGAAGEIGGDLDDLDDELAALLADPTMWDEPDADLQDRVVAAVRSEATLGDASLAPIQSTVWQRWARPALLGAVAALVFVFGAVVVLSAASGVEDRETFASELISTGRLADISGDVEITTFPSGLRIDLDAPSLPRRDNGTYYEAWLLTIDGNLVPVGTFHEGDGVILWAGVELDAVEAFTITLEETTTGDNPLQGSSGEIVLRTLVTR